jgi:hypothetical protein
MKTYLLTSSRKQYRLAWYDGNTEEGARLYPRNEKGAKSAARKIAALVDAGYTVRQPESSWWQQIQAEVAQENSRPNVGAAE